MLSIALHVLLTSETDFCPPNLFGLFPQLLSAISLNADFPQSSDLLALIFPLSITDFLTFGYSKNLTQAMDTLHPGMPSRNSQKILLIIPGGYKALTSSHLISLKTLFHLLSRGTISHF